MQPVLRPVGAERWRSSNLTSGVASSGRVRANSASRRGDHRQRPVAEQVVFQPGLSLRELLSITSLTVIGKLHFSLIGAE